MLKHYTLLMIALLGFVSESQAANPFTYNSLNDGPSVLTATQAPQPADEAVAAQEPAAAEARADVPVTREVPPSDVPAAPVEQAPVEQAPIASEQPVVQTPMPIESEVASGEPMAAASADAAQSAPVMQSTPVYRSSRGYRPMYGGVLGELIELERRKNAWIRRNVFGR